MTPSTPSMILVLCLATLLWTPSMVDGRPNLSRRQDPPETTLPDPTFSLPPPPTISLPPTLPPPTTEPPPPTTTPPPPTTEPPPPITTPPPPTTTTPPPPITTEPGPPDEPVTTTSVPPSLPPDPVTSTTFTSSSTDTDVTSGTDVTTDPTGTPGTGTLTTDTTSITDTTGTGTDLTDTPTPTGPETETSTGTETTSTVPTPPVPSSAGSSDSGTASATGSLGVTGTDTTTATDGPITFPPPPPRTDTVTGDGITTTFVPSIPPVMPSLSQGRETVSNSSVAPDDSQIQFTGGNWEPAPVPPVPKCVPPDAGSGTGNATAQRATQVGSKIEYSFVGTAIYLNTVVGPSGGVFTASIDGERADVDTHRALTSSTCEVTWSMWGLPNTNHQVTIEFRGASTDTDNPADAGLAIANFVVTKDESSAGLRTWAPNAAASSLAALLGAFFLFA